MVSMTEGEQMITGEISRVVEALDTMTAAFITAFAYQSIRTESPNGYLGKDGQSQTADLIRTLAGMSAKVGRLIRDAREGRPVEKSAETTDNGTQDEVSPSTACIRDPAEEAVLKAMQDAPVPPDVNIVTTTDNNTKEHNHD